MVVAAMEAQQLLESLVDLLDPVIQQPGQVQVSEGVHELDLMRRQLEAGHGVGSSG